MSTSASDKKVFNMAAGAVSGAVSACVTAPLELVKTVLQCKPTAAAAAASSGTVSITIRTPGTMATLAKIAREEGFQACFKGLSPTLLGIAPTWGIYFAVYDSAKDAFMKASRNSMATASIGASVLAGGVSTVVTNPIWVVKTRMSTCSKGTYRSVVHAFSSIYMKEGIKPFFAGLGVSLLGLVHVVIQFPMYEYLKTELGPNTLDEEGKERTSLLGVAGASLISKVASSVATYPHEVVRARLQNESRVEVGEATRGVTKQVAADGKRKRRGSFSNGNGAVNVCRKMIVEEGVSSLYAGMGVNLLKAVPSCMITFVMYELLSGRLN